MADSPDDRAPANALLGELVASGEYEDVVELGRGGMGVVYKARNTLLGRVEVLKVMSRQVMARAGAADRFRREIQSAARLSHPNVVGAYSARMVGGLLVFSMEYVPGDDFDRLVKSRGPLPVAHSAYYARQVADGLQHAHDHGMVHRDIKPANLILSRDGKRPVVKILDFGLARLVSDDSDSPRLTAAGRMLGTPDFVSPEQALDAQSADIRSDIYSLGCTLYFFLTGRAPFQAGSAVAVLLQHRTATAEYLHTVRPDVPIELAAVVARMMEKPPAKRYQTPAAVAEALAPFGRELTDAPPAPARKVTARVERIGAPVFVPVPVPGAPPAPPPADSLVVQPHPSAWESLPSLSQSGAAASEFVSRHRQRNWAPLAVGVLAAVVLAGMVGMWMTGAFHPAKTGGTVVIDNLPQDAEVEVNGKKVALSRDGDDWATSLPPGRYRVRVVRGGKELHTEVVTVEDAATRVTLRVPPPLRTPAKTAPPVKAAALPAFTAADRRRWVHDKGNFEWTGGGGWVETTPDGTTTSFLEQDRTAEYIELRNPGYTSYVRLHATRCEFAPSLPRTYVTRYTGGWVGSAPAPAPTITPQVASPPSAVPPTFPDSAVLFDRTYIREAIETTPHRHGETGGHYIIDCPTSGALWAWNAAGDVPANCAVEAVGLVQGGPTGSWGMNLTNIQSVPLHGVQVMLNGKGEVSVSRGMYERDPDVTGPTVGPLAHPAIKSGTKYNTLLLVVKNRVLDVYVNGVRVCDPLPLGRDVTPARVSLTGSQSATPTPAPVVAEFRRVRAWAY